MGLPAQPQHLLRQLHAALAAAAPHLGQRHIDAQRPAPVPDEGQLGISVVDKAVDRHHTGQAVYLGDVLHMLEKVGQALFQRLQIFRPQLPLGHAAVILQCLHRGHDDHRAGVHPRRPALDIQKLLRAQVRAEARLRHHVVRQLEGGVGGGHGVAAVGDIGEGPAVDQGRGVLQGLDQIGLYGILQQGGHGPLGLQVGGGNRPVVIGVAHDDTGQALLQILQIGGQAQHRHDLGGHGDIEAVLPGHTLHPSPQAVHNAAQLAVVHIHAPPPGDLLHVDAQGVPLLDVVVQQGRQQVIRRADGVEVPGKVKVDILHGHHLGMAAPRRAPLHPEHRTQGRLPQAQKHVLVQPFQRVRQPHAGGGFALPGRGGIDGGDQDELSLSRTAAQGGGVNLGFHPAIVLQQLPVDARLGGHLVDGQHVGALGDLNVGFHGGSSSSFGFHNNTHNS